MIDWYYYYHLTWLTRGSNMCVNAVFNVTDFTRLIGCVCVSFHPPDRQDGLRLFICSWLQDNRGNAREAIRQQVADANLFPPNLCAGAGNTSEQSACQRFQIVNPFSGNWNRMTRPLTQLSHLISYALVLSLHPTSSPPSHLFELSAHTKAEDCACRRVLQVYNQECEMFGFVVKMLIGKDPSLEHPIQSSLQENLREIGKRCVQAMERFIEEYDSRELPHWSSILSNFQA